MDIEQYKGKAGWYTFPDGEKKHGAEAAQEYAAELEDTDAPEAAESDAEQDDSKTDPDPSTDAADADTATDDVVDDGDAEQDAYLIEMTRQNRLFEYVGQEKRYQFKHDAKILVVDTEDIDDLLDEGGFRMVNPEKAKEYYS